MPIKGMGTLVSLFRGSRWVPLMIMLPILGKPPNFSGKKFPPVFESHVFFFLRLIRISGIICDAWPKINTLIWKEALFQKNFIIVLYYNCYKIWYCNHQLYKEGLTGKIQNISSFGFTFIFFWYNFFDLVLHWLVDR